MSARFRARQRQHEAEHLERNSESEGRTPVVSFSEMDSMYSPSFPGPREDYTPDAANYVTYGAPVGNIRDQVDWEIGGQPGMTKFVGSTGVVGRNSYDAFDFMGEQAVVRRMADTNYGPVTGSDYNALLATLYVYQEANQYFPNEAAQGDVIKAV